MGIKAADNEQLKLRAAFYNNLAVSAAVAGIILPLVTFYQQHWTIVEFITQSSWRDLFHYLLPTVVGIATAAILRLVADTTAQRIQN